MLLGACVGVKAISRTIHYREHMSTSRARLEHASDADERGVHFFSSMFPEELDGSFLASAAPAARRPVPHSAAAGSPRVTLHIQRIQALFW